MLIKALSKKDFDRLMRDNKLNDSNIESYPNLYIISIIYTYLNNHYFKRNHQNVLNLKFDDTNKVERVYLLDTKKYDTIKPMTMEQGEDIINFLSKIKPNDNTQLIIHCNAGISRSGAVSEFASIYFDYDYNKLKRDSPKINPNAHVLSLLKRIYYERT